MPVIEGVLDFWFYVDNGKVAGRIAQENVSAYRDPATKGPVAETARALSRESTSPLRNSDLRT